MFQLKDSQIGRILSYLGEDQSFCSVQALKELAEALPHEGGPPALVSLLIQTLISSKSILTDAPRIILTKYLGTLCPGQVDT